MKTDSFIFTGFSANGTISGSLTGVRIGTVTQAQKIWGSFQALGDIAFAYAYALILIEIQVHSDPFSFTKAVFGS